MTLSSGRKNQLNVNKGYQPRLIYYFAMLVSIQLKNLKVCSSYQSGPNSGIHSEDLVNQSTICTGNKVEFVRKPFVVYMITANVKRIQVNRGQEKYTVSE